MENCGSDDHQDTKHLLFAESKSKKVSCPPMDGCSSPMQQEHDSCNPNILSVQEAANQNNHQHYLFYYQERRKHTSF